MDAQVNQTPEQSPAPQVFCPNCGSQITCGCQQRVASNGAHVCSSCHAQYEQNLYSTYQMMSLSASNPNNEEPVA